MAAEWSAVKLTGTFTSTSALFVPPANFTPAQLAANGITPRGKYFAQGWYVEVMYFLTGDHRTFRVNQPAFDRVSVNEKAFATNGPLGSIFGTGAWEIGARYDWLDLTNNGINGGIAHAYTVGVNWHWNENMKVQWNYIVMTRDFEPTDTGSRRPGVFDGFGMRFHVDF
jgi:phosphate-selective porin OprO/OprP